jgi:hypothetical protein
MRLLLLIALVLFVLAPVDAQYLLLASIRDLWLTPVGRAFAAGAAGALVIGLFFFNHVWNALSYQIYLDDVKRAEDGHKRRKKG